MIVAFRADASIEIGTGHVMRCLTLARALRSQGAHCCFVTRDLPGHLAERLSRDRFEVALLPAPKGAGPVGPPRHARWAGVDWTQDCAETKAALNTDPPDWLVVDHYAFDARWERAARPAGTRCMVIDDLADRHHDCELLLDQNLGHHQEAYDGLVPEGCTCLMGPHYALLRPEFAELRAQSLARRKQSKLRRILITMGGVDAADATSLVLRALHAAPLPEDLHITVVMGSHAPALEGVKALADAMPWPTEVIVDTPDIANQMAMADLAISAGGGTTWERCSLGLPSIIVETAENQAGIAQAMADFGAALDPGPMQSAVFAQNLHMALAKACDLDYLSAMSQMAASVCDAEGCNRSVQKMLALASGTGG